MFDTQSQNTQFMPFLPPGESLSKDRLLADIAHKKAVAYHLMSLIQAHQGNLERALQSIHEAIEIYPRNAEWFLVMAQIYQNMGNHVDAQAARIRAQELDADIRTS
jgi:Flp pilus assembly protein TadD